MGISGGIRILVQTLPWFLLSGLLFDHFHPDIWDKAGAVLVLFGVGLMILVPRG